MNRGRIDQQGARTPPRSGVSVFLAGMLLLWGPLAFPSVQASGASAGKGEDVIVEAARRHLAAGRFHNAITTLQNAVQENDEHDERRLARRLATLGVALSQAGAFGESIEVQHRALALYQSFDDPAGSSAVTLNLGGALTKLGDLEGGRRYIEEALAIKQRHGITRGLGTIHNNLAEIAEGRGDLAGARASLEQALAVYADTPDAHGESLVRSNLARVLAQRGDVADALMQVQVGETLAQTHDFQLGVMVAQSAHAQVLMICVKRGDLSPSERQVLLGQADASLHRALVMAQAQEDRDRSINLLERLSELRQMQGRPEEALMALRQAREADAEQRKQAGVTRANVLSARYEYQRQLREIERLRDQETRSEARLKRQRRGLWLMAALVVFASGGVLALWHRSRVRHAAAVQLRERNQTLSSALEQADQERQRTETFAMRQRRFLRLASEDLRGPLLEMRTLAERALVEEKPNMLRRSHAAIAQHAANLIWVTEQMLESAAHDAGVDAPHPAEVVDLVTLVRNLVDEAVPRALHRDQHLSFQSREVSAPVRMERTRCSVALRELIDILLYLNPARTRFVFMLEQCGSEVRIFLEAGTARLPDWQDIALGQASGDVTLRLALAWIQHAIQDNGGRIETERHTEPGQRGIVIRFLLAENG